MAIEIRVPSLGESVIEATVGRWLKQAGDPVGLGEPLVELETDKVNTQIAAEAAGVLANIAHSEGDTVHPGDVLALINPAAGAAPAPAAAPAEAPAPATGPVLEPEVHATPLAQRVAEDLQVDIRQVAPSGPGGRITREDVETYARGNDRGAAPAAVPAPPPPPAVAAPPPPAEVRPEREAREERVRLSRRRLIIAKRLVEAQQTAAMLTTFNDVDMTAVMDLRKRWKDRFKEKHGVSLGFMSFFTKACIGALKSFPQLNAELVGEELVLKHYYDIGIAIGDPEGLVVPVLRDADRLTFAQVEQAIADFARRARERALTPDELRGGTFTITNGGVFGSLLSTPILNPPQTGILGMHRIQERPVAINGDVVIRPMMYVALTYDHRVIDGREAVQFLVRLKELIENPESMLLEG